MEFEHAMLFAAVNEAGDIAKSKSWGVIISVKPLEPGDSLHPMRIVYQLKPTSNQRMRWVFRDTLKEYLRKKRSLVNDAVRLTKTDFLRFLKTGDEAFIKAKVDLTASEFWVACRYGERFGPGGIERFARALEEKIKGYRFPFPSTPTQLVQIQPAPGPAPIQPRRRREQSKTSDNLPLFPGAASVA